MNFEYKNTSKKIFAILMATMCVSVVVAGMIVEEESDESDAFVISGSAALWLGYTILPAVSAFIAGTVVGYLAYDYLNENEGQDNTDEIRDIDADWLDNIVENDVADYTDTSALIQTIWTHTKEHYIRQSELATSVLWSEDATKDINAILDYSGTFANSSYTMMNMGNIGSKYLHGLSDRLDLWNAQTGDQEFYVGNMSLGYRYGNEVSVSNQTFDGTLTSATSITSTYNDRVYIATEEDNGSFWVFGGSATIKNVESNRTYVLSAGCNNLNNIDNFEDGIYELQAGREYAGNMISIKGSEPAGVTSGIVMNVDSNLKLARYSGGNVIVDSSTYSTLEVRILPTGGTTQSVDIIPLLTAYSQTLSTINTVISEAASSASAMWNIFDRAGEATTYLTTLAVNENYENVTITDSQKEVITILALEQLAEYYNSHSSQIKTGDYTFSEESLNLYVRGDIYSATNELLASDVIFTPFYYFSDQTLTEGTQTQTQSATVAIWGEGTNLSGWLPGTSMDLASLLNTSSGYKFDIYEIKYDGQVVESVDLAIETIDVVETSEMEQYITDYVDNSGNGPNWLKIAIILIGVVATAYGLLTRHTEFVFVGIGCVAVGFLMGSTLWEWIS